PPEEAWDPRRGWNVNFERYLRRQVLSADRAPLVWGMDEVDRLFTCPFAGEVFGLFRSWHNARSLDPAAPWARLTLAIAFARAAPLSLIHLHRSPYTRGPPVSLPVFPPDEVAELTRRYGSLLRDAAEVAGFYELLGGHPYLVRRGLHEMALRGLGLQEIRAL